MDKITIKYQFLLESGEIGSITIKDVSEGASETDITALKNEILARDTRIKGQRLTEYEKCVKTTVVEEELILS